MENMLLCIWKMYKFIRMYMRTMFWNNRFYHPIYIWFIVRTRQTMTNV